MTSATTQCDDDWTEIEQLLSEVAALTRSCRTLETFSEEMLRRAVDFLNSFGGAVWEIESPGQFRQVSCIESQASPCVAGPQLESEHRRFINEVVESGRSRVSTAQRRAPDAESVMKRVSETVGQSASDAVRDGAEAWYWVAAPFQAEQGVGGVIEIIQPSSISPTGLTGCERLLAMLAELTGEFMRRQQLNDLQITDQQWQQYESLSQRAHASLDLRETCYQLANDGRLFVGCDRVSFVVAINGELKTMAISGVDTFDRRANLVRSMERLAKAVAQSRQWLRYRGSAEQLPPQIEQPLSEFADESHSQTVDVVPLIAAQSNSGGDTDQLLGVVLLERFDATAEESVEQRIVRFSTLSSAAIRNAIDYQTLPLLSISRGIRGILRAGNRRRRLLVTSVTLLLLTTLALCLIPATFFVEAEGKAQPQIRRNLYAPLDGEVVKIEGTHDEEVLQEQVLVVLRSRELEVELQRLRGEYQTTEKKLLAVASARVQNKPAGDSDRFPGQLAAEEQELKQQLDSLQVQLDLLRQQRDQLTLRSPIKGRVMTWDPKELLVDRPVQRGQLLVSVADVVGPWILELVVPERRAGHLIDASRSQDGPLEVHFTLATGNAPTFRGTLQKIAGRTEVIDDDQTATRIRVDIPQDAVESLRPGIAVHAKIDCGKRSLGFVWLHDLFETVQSWMVF